MYTSLLAEFDQLRARTARFRRVALHIHSPDSHDWARGKVDEGRNQRTNFDSQGGLVKFGDELKAHLDLVGITDHMRCSFAANLSKKVSHSDVFCVLPGMEVNLTLEPPLNFARIHLLTILPEGSSIESFACLFKGLNAIPRDDASRTGQEEVAGLTLKEWVDHVHGENGLCIAAHVENKQGVRRCFRQTAQETLRLFYDGDDSSVEREMDIPGTFKDYLLDSRLDAIEVHKSSDAIHYRWSSRKDGAVCSIATVLRFDAHCCEEFNRPERITHIKMTSLGINGLRNAMRFPDTRIRFPSNVPGAPSPHILGIAIKGNEASFFEDVKIALAENLNCLVGVRGSGKSTVVEALRYAFGYNRSLKTLGKSMQDGIRDMQKANLTGTQMRVVYRIRSGEVRLLTATFDDKEDYVTKVYDEAGDPVEVADVEASGDYPLRLFGWSEIEKLGRDPVRQRQLLDRLVPELMPVLRARDGLRQQLGKNRGAVAKAVEEVKATFDHNNREITRYKEFRADFEKLNTKAVRELFSSLDLAKGKRRVLVRIGQNCERIQANMEDVSPDTLHADLEATLEKGSDELREWWLKKEQIEIGLADAEVGFKKDIDAAGEKLETLRQTISSRVESIDEAISDLQRGLQEKLEESDDSSMQRIADLRENAESRLRRVSETRRKYQNTWRQLVIALQERDGICAELQGKQHEIAGIRSQYNQEVEERLNRFLPDSMHVSILFKAGGDKQAFAESLKAVVPGRNTGQVKRTRVLLKQLANPVTCAQAVANEEYSTLIGRNVTTDQGDDALTEEDISAWLSKARPFEHNEHADVPILAEGGSRLENLLNLQETTWDDYETILLNGGPVNAKSPGQRSSAMLPLIALAEKAPLVIDQPEDNLDKRLIGSVLVKVLAELKEKRQITVCTHDPNILVGGDAEQVIVLEATSDRKGRVCDHGSIDNESIVKTVIDLLEGGADAFEARRRRYGLDGENAAE